MRVARQSYGVLVFCLGLTSMATAQTSPRDPSIADPAMMVWKSRLPSSMEIGKRVKATIGLVRLRRSSAKGAPQRRYEVHEIAPSGGVLVKSVENPEPDEWSWEVTPTRSGLVEVSFVLMETLESDGRTSSRIVGRTSDMAVVRGPQEWVVIVLGVGVGGAIFGGRLLLLSWTTRKREKTLQAAVRHAEQRLIGEVPYPVFLQNRVDLIAKRARLQMLEAKSRADRLSTIGTLFAVLSVCAPVAAGLLYASVDPLSPSLVENVARLRNEDGTLPDGVTVATAKDWRVLASGVSFGFLFLAAAGALFSQHRRQMETFFALARDVDHTDAIGGAVAIQARADQLGGLTETMKALTDRTISLLLERQAQGLPPVAPPEASSILDEIRATLEKLRKGVLGDPTKNG